jgi:WD40 repeat protein
MILACCGDNITVQSADIYPSAPILRINNDSHTANIRGGGMNRAGTLLLTASEDKTARLWSVADGRLVKVLRPPIGNGSVSELTAATLSPDGTFAAVGGWTPRGTNQSFIIFIFLTASGQVVHELDTQAGVPIRKLRWSADGRYLAAGLSTTPRGIGQGMRVWRTADWVLAGQEPQYDGTCLDLSFDGSDRLVTVTSAGEIFLYDNAFRLIAKGGHWDGQETVPSVAFSPDGSKIAAALDGAAITIFSGTNLARLFQPVGHQPTLNWVGPVFTSTEALAWSDDGQTIYASVDYWDHMQLFQATRTLSVIRAWGSGARAAAVDVALPDQPDPRIEGLYPQPGGGLAFTRGATWGLLTKSGRPAVRPSDASSFVARTDHAVGLPISPDGRSIVFSAGPDASRTNVFSIDDRRVQDVAFAPAGYHSPTTSVPGAAFSGLFTDHPRLNGRPLALAFNGDIVGAAAVGRQGMFLSEGNYLNGYTLGGELRWRHASGTEGRYLNLSSDGRLLVVAHADGTIRWYSTSNGHELLALFPDNDGQRWVLWTPSGYFDASPGGEDLIGWHVNRGLGHAADFFPASRFHDQFFRPDIVSLVLTTLDETQAVAQGNAQRPTALTIATTVPDITKIEPPIVTILSPSDGQAIAGVPFALHFAVRSPSGQAVQWVELRFDGRPANETTDRDTARLASASASVDAQATMSVTAPPGTKAISLIARTATGISEAAELHLRSGGLPPSERPKLYLLAVGVSAYSQASLRLGYAAKDAEDFSRVMKTHGRLYRDVESRVLDDASRADILAGLAWLKTAPARGDYAMLFLAGHGGADQGGVYYYLPRDGDPSNLPGTAISNRDLIDTVSAIRGKVMLFLDTCHSGAALSAASRGLINKLISAENGAMVFTSSTGAQLSLESPAWNNGAFTKELVEGLSGGADKYQKGNVTVADLNLWLSIKVKELTNQKQDATFVSLSADPDFPISQ